MRAEDAPLGGGWPMRVVKRSISALRCGVIRTARWREIGQTPVSTLAAGVLADDGPHPHTIAPVWPDVQPDFSRNIPTRVKCLLAQVQGPQSWGKRHSPPGETGRAALGRYCEAPGGTGTPGSAGSGADMRRYAQICAGAFVGFSSARSFHAEPALPVTRPTAISSQRILRVPMCFV